MAASRQESAGLQIREDDLTGSQITALLREHLADVYDITPPESVRALDLAALRSPAVTLWSAWDGDELLGCGALKELDPQTGEIKSMRTVEAHRRRGVARRLLEHILQVATQRGYANLYLETGIPPAFTPALELYKRYGFQFCEPFADHTSDPETAFMTRSL